MASAYALSFSSAGGDLSNFSKKEETKIKNLPWRRESSFQVRGLTQFLLCTEISDKAFFRCVLWFLLSLLQSSQNDIFLVKQHLIVQIVIYLLYRGITFSRVLVMTVYSIIFEFIINMLLCFSFRVHFTEMQHSTMKFLSRTSWKFWFSFCEYQFIFKSGISDKF